MSEKTSRRALLQGSSLLAGLAMGGAAQETKGPSPGRPNVVLIIADQVRPDALGAYGVNPMDLTPNLNAMAQRGTLFRSMFTNQPVCSPSRACLFTGQYPATHGVWRNTGKGVGLSPNARTLATEFKKAGYSANYIGKWHLADDAQGPVPPAGRGGFLDLWQASNLLEFTSHPYEGDLYDGDGKPIHFANQYRSDFLTGLAKRFLHNASHDSPFLLVVSYLEPHQQNDAGHSVARNGYAERYRNPFVPEDLKHFPGVWQAQLPDYYGCIKRVDEAVGEIRQELVQTGLDRQTMVIFVSDHGCHFQTRNADEKLSGHDASIHIPLLIEGPGFNGAHEIRQSVAMVDLAPTILEAAGVPIPATMQGRSALPLLGGNVSGWRNEIFVQMASFWTARALRTPEWTYVLAAARKDVDRTFPIPERNAPLYSAFQLYDNCADPHQLVNLAGHLETKAIEVTLRERLKVRMQEAGDTAAELTACTFPYA